jgi:PIN domain nuclease of toxin-antitoxin system
MSRYLLDTHVFLWTIEDPSKLSVECLAALADPSHRFFVSAASVWEIAVKQAKRQLQFKGSVVDTIESMRIIELPISGRHSEASATLPNHHSDPFDRLLIAQTKMEGMILMTRDRAIFAYDVPLLRA